MIPSKGLIICQKVFLEFVLFLSKYLYIFSKCKVSGRLGLGDSRGVGAKVKLGGIFKCGCRADTRAWGWWGCWWGWRTIGLEEWGWRCGNSASGRQSKMPKMWWVLVEFSAKQEFRICGDNQSPDQVLGLGQPLEDELKVFWANKRPKTNGVFFVCLPLSPRASFVVLDRRLLLLIFRLWFFIFVIFYFVVAPESGGRGKKSWGTDSGPPRVIICLCCCAFAPLLCCCLCHIVIVPLPQPLPVVLLLPLPLWQNKVSLFWRFGVKLLRRVCNLSRRKLHGSGSNWQWHGPAGEEGL